MRVDIPESPCPDCGFIGNRGLSLNGARPPEPGDMAFCSMCGAINKLDEGLKLVALTPNDMIDILRDPGLRHAAKMAISLTRAMRKKQ